MGRTTHIVWVFLPILINFFVYIFAAEKKIKFFNIKKKIKFSKMAKNILSQLFGEQLLKTAMKNAVENKGNAGNGVADMVINGVAGNGSANTEQGVFPARRVYSAAKLFSNFFNLNEESLTAKDAKSFSFAHLQEQSESLGLTTRDAKVYAKDAKSSSFAPSQEQSESLGLTARDAKVYARDAKISSFAPLQEHSINKFINCFKVAAMVAVLLLCGVANSFAATQNWSGTKKFTVNQVIEDDIWINGTLTINVAEGVTVTVNGEVKAKLWVESGSLHPDGHNYGFTKKGKGKIIFNGLVFGEGDDGFGRIYVEEGTVQIGNGVSTKANLSMAYYSSVFKYYYYIEVSSGAFFRFEPAPYCRMIMPMVKGAGYVYIKGGNGSYVNVREDNTCTSALVLESGRLNIGTNNSGSPTEKGSWSKNINNNGEIHFHRSNQYVYKEEIYGPGSVYHDSSADLVFEKAQRYTGATYLKGKLKLVENGDISASSSVTMVSDAPNAALDITNIKANGAGINKLVGNNASHKILLGAKDLRITGQGNFAGVISGYGGLDVFAGSGATFVITGNNTYTGETYVDSGELVLGNGSTNGWISFTSKVKVNSGAKLSFSRSSSLIYIFDRLITGDGQVWINNGAVALEADNTYKGTTHVVKDASLYIGVGSNTGAVGGDIDLSAGSNLYIDRSNFVFSKVISGAGKVSVFRNASFSGINTYTGETVIANSGSLKLTGNGSIAGSSVWMYGSFDISSVTGTSATIKSLDGSLSSRVILGSKKLTIGTRDFNDGNGKFSGVIEGTGSVTKTGKGELVLLGANTYTGTTDINQGTIQIGDGTAVAASIESTSNVVINNSSDILRFEPAVNMTFSKVISGNGSVEYKGANSNIDLTLSANNTYTGTTTVESGNLNIGNGGTTGAIAGNIILSDGSTFLRFNRSGNYTYDKVISGLGNVIQYSTNGTLTLNNTNTYTGHTFIYGTLVLGANGKIENSAYVSFFTENAKFDVSVGNKLVKSLSSSITSAKVLLPASPNTLTISDDGNITRTFSGIFEGTGGVVKTGSNNWRMDGTSTATGSFRHNYGKLTFSGKWSGDFYSYADLTIAGTATVEGYFNLHNATVNMNLTAAAPAKIVVTGSLSAAGTNTLKVSTPATQTNYALITAASGIDNTANFTLATVSGYPNAAITAYVPTQLRFNTNASGSSFTYSEDDKEGLRVFFRQPSAIPGQFNGQIVGLTVTDTLNWRTSEDWLEKLKSSGGGILILSWTDDTPKRLYYFWCASFENIAGTLDARKWSELINLQVSTTSVNALNITDNVLLENLNISNTLIQSIDLSNNVNLKILMCSNNPQLAASLDLRNLAILNSIIVNNNNLTSLEFNNPSLEFISCSKNKLTSLDLSVFPKLGALVCNDNPLNSLNLNDIPNLVMLECKNLNLTSLDLSNPQLFALDCSGNNITYLDFSKMTPLTPPLDYLNIICYNNRLPLSVLYEASKSEPKSSNKYLGTQNLYPVEMSMYSTYGTGENIFDGQYTQYSDVKKNGANAVINMDYSVSNGLITFKTTGNYTFSMTNAAIESYTNYPAIVNATVKVSSATLEGGITINGNAVYGETLTADISGLTSYPEIELGNITYEWKRDNTVVVGTNSSYTLVKEDIGWPIYLYVSAANCNGEADAFTLSVLKASQSVPSAPAILSSTERVITLNPVSGCEYSIDYSDFMQSNIFEGLTPGTEYRFTQRKAETDTHSASESSEPVTFSTVALPSLNGTITISGNAVVLETLTATADLTSTVEPGALTYIWRSGGYEVGSNSSTYEIEVTDFGNTITVTVTAENCGGSVTSAATAVVVKAWQPAPPAPVMADRTSTSITLNDVEGCEYSINGDIYQPMSIFAGLNPNTAYTFTQRKAETETHAASDASEPATFTTGTAPGTIYVIHATVNNPEWGYINPSGYANVEEGGNITFYITPYDGYIIEYILVNGSSIDAVTEYTFENVLSNGTIEVFFKEFVSIKQLTVDSEELRVYPNPTNGQLRITIAKNEANELRNVENVEIFDMTGHLVYSYGLTVLPSNGLTFDISRLPNGVYYLKVGKQFAKIVKN